MITLTHCWESISKTKMAQPWQQLLIICWLGSQLRTHLIPSQPSPNAQPSPLHHFVKLFWRMPWKVCYAFWPLMFAAVASVVCSLMCIKSQFFTISELMEWAVFSVYFFMWLTFVKINKFAAPRQSANAKRKFCTWWPNNLSFLLCVRACVCGFISKSLSLK